MSRQTGGVSWQEEHFVVYVHDVYTDRRHGRVIEFYAEDGGMRVVPAKLMRVTVAGAKSIDKKQKSATDHDRSSRAREIQRTSNRQNSAPKKVRRKAR